MSLTLRLAGGARDVPSMQLYAIDAARRLSAEIQECQTFPFEIAEEMNLIRFTPPSSPLPVVDPQNQVESAAAPQSDRRRSNRLMGHPPERSPLK